MEILQSDTTKSNPKWRKNRSQEFSANRPRCGLKLEFKRKSRGMKCGAEPKGNTKRMVHVCDSLTAPGKKPFPYHQLMCSMKRRTSRHAPVLLLYPLVFLTSHVAHWLCTHRHTHTQIQTHNLSLKETLVIFSGKSVQAGKKETFKQAESILFNV